jgi:hypothetical protein
LSCEFKGTVFLGAGGGIHQSDYHMAQPNHLVQKHITCTHALGLLEVLCQYYLTSLCAKTPRERKPILFLLPYVSQQVRQSGPILYSIQMCPLSDYWLTTTKHLFIISSFVLFIVLQTYKIVLALHAPTFPSVLQDII